MSRAFTKETDEDPFRLPDRPVSASPNLVTPRGAELISAELARSEAELLAGIGDRDALRRDQRYWSLRQASMQVVPPVAAPASVTFGVCVRIRRAGKEIEVRIVGEDEANPREKRVAWTSPLAVALDGAEVSETVQLKAGGLVEHIQLLAIRA